MSCCREEKGRTDHCRQPRDLFVHDVYPFSEVDQVVEGSNLVLFKGGEAANRAENSAGCLRSKLGEKAMGRLRKLRRRPWALKYHWAAGMGGYGAEFPEGTQCRKHQSPRSLRPGWSSGLRPSGQWKSLSDSLMGLSLMHAKRRCIRPSASNSQFSFP